MSNRELSFPNATASFTTNPSASTLASVYVALYSTGRNSPLISLSLHRVAQGRHCVVEHGPCVICIQTFRLQHRYQSCVVALTSLHRALHNRGKDSIPIGEDVKPTTIWVGVRSTTLAVLSFNKKILFGSKRKAPSPLRKYEMRIMKDKLVHWETMTG